MKNDEPSVSGRLVRDVQDAMEGSTVVRAERRPRSGFNWPHRQTEDDHEERWQDNEFFFNNKLDGFLFAPLIFYFAALTDWRPGFGLVFVYGSSALALLIWLPWITFRVAMRAPVGDYRRAAAILAFALPAWIVPALLLIVSTKAAVYVGFPIVYAWSGAAMLMAVRQRPPPQSPRRRRALQTAGGVIYLLTAAAVLSLVSQAFLGGRARAEALGSFGWLMVLLGLLVGLAWVFLGFKLITGPSEPPRRKRTRPAAFSD